MKIDQIVRDYIKGIFRSVDDEITTKISKTPNIPEESLDIEFIHNRDYD